MTESAATDEKARTMVSMSRRLARRFVKDWVRSLNIFYHPSPYLLYKSCVLCLHFDPIVDAFWFSFLSLFLHHDFIDSLPSQSLLFSLSQPLTMFLNVAVHLINKPIVELRLVLKSQDLRFLNVEELENLQFLAQILNRQGLTGRRQIPAGVGAMVDFDYSTLRSNSGCLHWNHSFLFLQGSDVAGS